MQRRALPLRHPHPAICRAACADRPLQPALADAVRARAARWQGQWEPGTVVKQNYRESDWPKGQVAAYQVKLDNGT